MPGAKSSLCATSEARMRSRVNGRVTRASAHSNNAQVAASLGAAALVSQGSPLVAKDKAPRLTP
jgi:hypothetical protein